MLDCPLPFLGVLVLSIAGLPAGGLADPGDLRASDPGDPTSQCSPHPPIEIVGDEGPRGFVLAGQVTPAPVYRPGSGVVDGQGTPEDPYLIRGWCLRGIGETAGLDIEDTRAHVHVVDNRIEDSLDPAPNPDAVEDSKRGIRLVNATNVSIVDNRVADQHVGGILLDEAASTTIEDNRIVDNTAYGIRLFAAEANHVRSNTFADNGELASFEGPVAGVMVRSSTDNTIEANTFEPSPSTAVRVEEGQRNRVADNAIWEPDPMGVRVDRSADTTIAHNVIEDAAWDGIQLRSATGTTVTANRITAPAERGLLVAGGGDSHVEANTIHASGRHGIQLGSANDTLLDNRIEDPGRAAIYLWRATDAELAANTMTAGGVLLQGYRAQAYDHEIEASNRVAGEPVRYLDGAAGVHVENDAGQVFVVDADNVTVEGQDARNVAVAVQAAFSANTTVRDSRVSEASWSGVDVHRSQSTRVHNVTATGNRLDGFEVRYSPSTLLEDVRAEDNGRHGIHLDDSEASVLRSSTALDHGQHGVVVDGSPGTLVANTTVERTDEAGIDVGRSADTLVENATVREAGRDGILITETQDVTVRDSDVRDSGEAAIGLGRADGTQIHGSNLVDNGLGVGQWQSQPVDATGNWWGCPQGPGDEACDDADDGVRTDPWLEAPNPEAGAPE